MNISRIILIAIVTMFSFAAQADPIQADVEYQLGNHPDGNAGPPLYGLRLDGLTTGDSGDIFTFEFSGGEAEMYLYWTGYELYIYGTVYGGLNEDGGYADGEAGQWYVEFVYFDTYACSDGSGLCADDGFGYFENEDASYHLDAYTGNHDYAIQLDYGHRGFDGISGWGWVNHCPYEQAYDSDDGTCGGGHLNASDWLFTVNTVPEPGTLALMGLGLLGLGLTRKRRRVA